MTDATSQPEPVDPSHDPEVDAPPDDDRDAAARAEVIYEPGLPEVAGDLDEQPWADPRNDNTIVNIGTRVEST